MKQSKFDDFKKESAEDRIRRQEKKKLIVTKPTIHVKRSNIKTVHQGKKKIRTLVYHLTRQGHRDLGHKERPAWEDEVVP